MNERIRELAEHCVGSRPYNTFDYEKFAELIVRECADIVEETRWMVPPSQEQIARSIKQHFRVEDEKQN
jgi:hypothetical protein